MNTTIERMTTAVTLGTVVPELAEVVLMAASETLKILRAAVELDEFTQPELAAVSGASYEMVKKVLRAEHGETVEKLDRTVKPSTGRPSNLWRVTDRSAIERRLAESLAKAERDVETLRTPGEVPHMQPPQPPLLESALCAAEDHLVFALSSEVESDVAGFARDALTEIEPFDEHLAVDWGDIGTSALPLGRKRNVPIRLGRAQVIRAMSDYLVSDEASGFQGHLWRRAFDAMSSFDHSRQAGLHKFFMTSLVNLATQRLGRPVARPRSAATPPTLPTPMPSRSPTPAPSSATTRGWPSITPSPSSSAIPVPRRFGSPSRA